MIISYTFTFGTAPGTYAVGSRLTDSILRRGKVVSLILDNVPNNADVIQDMSLGILDLSAFTLASGSILTVIFEAPIQL